MLVPRLSALCEKKLSGHLKMENEAHTAIAFDDDHLPAPPHTQNAPPRENREPAARSPAQQRFEQKLGPLDNPAADPWREAPHDRFHFGKFRHIAILSEKTGPILYKAIFLAFRDGPETERG
jgi:hypothetical protein